MTRHDPARCPLLAALCLALTACAAAAPAGDGASGVLPVSASGAALEVRVTARNLSAFRIDLLVHLVARRDLPLVVVRGVSADRRLTIASGCTFQPLRPPRVSGRRSPPYALPAVPLCSLTLQAREAGRYSIEVRVSDGAGHDWVAPIRTIVSFPREPR